ncbi:MAG TPA: glycosyltransferase family 4 protein [Candidatus Methylomirabilis sp.]|nr:glycosyltransferase family 4 protein [Candidatus Methylomirabilis sp.]
MALDLVRGLDPGRFRSYLVCPRSLLETFGCEWRVADAEALALSLYLPWQIGPARRFVNYLRSRQIDVVHAHMVRASVVAVPLARLAGVPVVVQTCHGREAWRTSGLRRRYWIDRLIGGLSDATIAVSESTRDYLLQEKQLDPRKVVVIRNGRSLAGFTPSPDRQERLRAEFGVRPGEAVLGVFGRLEEQKGHRYLLEALSLVLDQVPEVKVLLVGDGSLRGQLEFQAQSHGLCGCVLFTGYRYDWKDLMALSDLVLLPSLYEGLPLVPIEAAILGKPVLATSVDGTREVVVDGFTGRLVPPGQSRPFAEALIELLRHPELRLRLGEGAQVRALDLFSLERQLLQTSDLYSQLVEGTTPQQRKMIA